MLFFAGRMLEMRQAALCLAGSWMNRSTWSVQSRLQFFDMAFRTNLWRKSKTKCNVTTRNQIVFILLTLSEREACEMRTSSWEVPDGCGAGAGCRAGSGTEDFLSLCKSEIIPYPLQVTACLEWITFITTRMVCWHSFVMVNITSLCEVGQSKQARRLAHGINISTLTW